MDQQKSEQHSEESTQSTTPETGKEQDNGGMAQTDAADMVSADHVEEHAVQDNTGAVSAEDKLAEAKVETVGDDQVQSVQEESAVEEVVAAPTSTHPSGVTTIMGKLVVQWMDEYLAIMGPGSVHTENEGIRQQSNMLQLLTTMVNAVPEEDFKRCMDYVCAKFREHSDSTLHELNALRYIENVVMDVNSRNAWQRLVMFFREFSDFTKHADAKRSININWCLELGLTDEGRNRLLNYFRI